MENYKKQEAWWDNKGGFFGRNLYMRGDDNLEGYLLGADEALNQRTKREAEGALRLAGINMPSKILDIPCGYGRHSCFFHKMGHTVLGIDINEEHLDEAKKYAMSEEANNRYSRNLQFLKGDMRKLPKKIRSKFDLLTNMTLSFGFFEDEEENVQSMREFYRTLREGGKLILHTDVSPEIINSNVGYPLSEKRNLRDGGKLFINEKYDPISKRLNGTWTLIGEKGEEEQLTPYSVRIYTANEFMDMAREVGFKSAEVYGSFQGEKFDKNTSKEMILVAKK